MPHRTLLYLAIIALVACLPVACPAANDFDQPKYLNYGGLVIATNAVLPLKEIHPVLWFKQTEIDTLLKKRDADYYAQRLWRQINQDVLLTQSLPEPPLASDGQKVQEYYSVMSRLAQVNALMSLLGESGKQAQYPCWLISFSVRKAQIVAFFSVRRTFAF